MKQKHQQHRLVLCLILALFSALILLLLSDFGFSAKRTWGLADAALVKSIPFGPPMNYKTWNHLGRASPHIQKNVTIFLYSSNEKVLEQLFWDVSNPKHPKYGLFPSHMQTQKALPCLAFCLFFFKHGRAFCFFGGKKNSLPSNI